MKKLISIITIFTLILSTLSCTKELEFGSNFDFQINNLNNETTIILNSEKTFSIEVLKAFNPSNSKNYKISYKSNDIELISNNTTLLPSTDYPFTLSELNTVDLTLKAKVKGDLKITFNLTDDFGTIKEQTILVKVIEDLNFTFTSINQKPLYEDVFTTPFTFALDLQNIGTGIDTYELKAFSSLGGEIKINNNLLLPNTVTPINQGNINVIFTPDNLGEQTITVIVINSKKIEKEVTFKLKINQKVFTVTTTGTLEVPQGTKTPFIFKISNTIPNWKYKVKFNSNTQSLIYNNEGVSIPLNTYFDLPLNKFSFSFDYLTNSNVDDILSITVQDQNNQEITSKLDITTSGKPIIENANAGIVNLSNNSFDLQSRYNIKAKAFNNKTIIEYEFKILNYQTNTNDTYTTESNDALYPTNFSYYQYFTKKKYNFQESKWETFVNHTAITGEDRNINYYYNQPYEIRVKDSQGLWSDTFKGIMTY